MPYLGIDVGGSSIKVGIVDAAGQLLETSSRPIPESCGGFFDLLTALWEEAAAKQQILGVGISSCGGIDPHTGDVTPCIAPRLQYLIGQNYYTLRQRIPVPVAVEKDGNCAALGEKWTGNARDLHSYCALVLGTGLGGGVIYRDRVYEGAHFLAGDVGYGFPSYDAPSGFSGLCAPVQVEDLYEKRTGQRLNIAQMYARRAYDPAAEACCTQFFCHLANTIITMQYILDPQAFVLGGGITAWDELIPLLQAEVDRQVAFRGLPARPVLRAAAHQNGANLIGAVYNLRCRMEAGEV